MGIAISSPVKRTVKNSKENYGVEIQYDAIVIVKTSGDDMRAVTDIKVALSAFADKYAAKYGENNQTKFLRTDAAVEKLFELAPQSTMAVLEAGFTLKTPQQVTKTVADLD